MPASCRFDHPLCQMQQEVSPLIGPGKGPPTHLRTKVFGGKIDIASHYSFAHDLGQWRLCNTCPRFQRNNAYFMLETFWVYLSMASPKLIQTIWLQLTTSTTKWISNISSYFLICLNLHSPPVPKKSRGTHTWEDIKRFVLVKCDLHWKFGDGAVVRQLLEFELVEKRNAFYIFMIWAQRWNWLSMDVTSDEVVASVSVENEGLDAAITCCKALSDKIHHVDVPSVPTVLSTKISLNGDTQHWKCGSFDSWRIPCQKLQHAAGLAKALCVGPFLEFHECILRAIVAPSSTH